MSNIILVLSDRCWVRSINGCFCYLDTSSVNVIKSFVLDCQRLGWFLKVRSKWRWLQPRLRRHFHRVLNLLIWLWFRV